MKAGSILVKFFFETILEGGTSIYFKSHGADRTVAKIICGRKSDGAEK